MTAVIEGDGGVGGAAKQPPPQQQQQQLLLQQQLLQQQQQQQQRASIRCEPGSMQLASARARAARRLPASPAAALCRVARRGRLWGGVTRLAPARKTAVRRRLLHRRLRRRRRLGELRAVARRRLCASAGGAKEAEGESAWLEADADAGERARGSCATGARLACARGRLYSKEPARHLGRLGA